MNAVVLLLMGVIFVGMIVVIPRLLQRYWDQETNRSDDDYEFDRRVASYNDKLAYQKRDDEIVRILRGRDVPTLAERYGINDNNDDEYAEDDE